MTNQLSGTYLSLICTYLLHFVYKSKALDVPAKCNEINNNVIDPQMKLISNEEIFSDIEPAGT